MKKVCQTFVLAAIAIAFVACQRQDIAPETGNSLPEPLDKENSVYVEEGEPADDAPYTLADPEMHQVISQLSEIRHQEMLLNPGNEQSFNKNDDGCCELIRVKEQKNPWWIGAEIDDREWPGVTDWYLNYRGYNHDTGNLIHDITVSLSAQACETNSIWWWWFGVPIDPSVSHHSSCPDPNGRAEFYLYMKFSHLTEPVLCSYAFKIFPIRANISSDPWCF